MQDMNRINLVARLTRDPELRALPSGTSVCELRVAYNTSRKGADGSWEDVGNFVNVSVWGNQGETVAKHLTKGQRVGIDGRLEHRTWKDKDGNNREAHSITAERVQYLDPKADGSGTQRAAQVSRPATPPVPAPAAPAVADDDDVPF